MIILTTTKKYTAALNAGARTTKKQARIIARMTRAVERGQLDPNNATALREFARQQLEK
jgi:hypothetical protein